MSRNHCHHIAMVLQCRKMTSQNLKGRQLVQQKRTGLTKKNWKVLQPPKEKYGRPKHRVTGRFSLSVEMLRKSYRLYIPVKSFNKSTSSKQPKSCSSIIGRHETWIAELHLTVCDENDILTPSNWLSDNHIYACRLIMKSQFPNLEGFTDTLLVSCGKVRNPIKRHEIHIHNQNIKQWVTSAFRNGTLTVYDFL